MPNHGSLFARESLREWLADRAEGARSKVRLLDRGKLMSACEGDMAREIVERYLVVVPTLGEPYQGPPRERDVDVSRDPMRDVQREGPVYVPGTEYVLVVPFAGTREVLEYAPPEYGGKRPRGMIEESSIVVERRYACGDESNVQPDFERDLSDIRQHLDWAASHVDEFNSSLRNLVASEIRSRRSRLHATDETAATMPWPVIRRGDATRTYAVPTVKRKVVPRRTKSADRPGEPEPELLQAEYEHILSVMDNMVQVMERSPSAFANMKEEDVRTHFLVQLNGQYEGQATGETFNNAGKTDILIRADGKNIFIAECKFWDGPKALTRGVDQLLSYACWRDTKTAVVIFNRNRDLTAVLDKIPGVIREHQCYKRDDMSFRHKTGCRFIMHQPGDTNRELQMTVLVYDVPSDHASGQ